MEIAIVGAGASGCVAAIILASRGYKVYLLERKDRILKKVLVTGNGTCNFTNINATYDNYFSIGNKISKEIFEKYSYKDVIEFFESLGILHKVESRGRVYPNSLQAASIVDALRFKIDSLNNIDLRLNFEVSKIRKKGFKFNISNNEDIVLSVDKVVIATGGISYPQLGSNGSGYELAKKMGHNVSKLYPVLAQLKTDKEYVKGLEGVRIKTKLKVYFKDKFLREDENELIFTQYGISGTVIFNMSYLTALYGMENIYFHFDFLPEYSEEKIVKILRDIRKNIGYSLVENFLNGLINKKLGIFLIKKIGIEKLNTKINKISDEEILSLAKILKKYVIKAYDTTGFSNAQVTAGGILNTEINNYTLESLIVKDLYFIGEVLDVFGDCGGYNLNWCFISGIHLGNLI